MQYSILPVNKELYENALKRQRDLAKPFGSLGALETYSARLAAITGELYPCTKARAIVVFASDNGVWDEGVTPIGKEVTALQSSNMTFGKAGIGVLAAHADAKLYVVDVGMEKKYESRYIINKKVRKSTSNIAKGPAMNHDEFWQAFEAGAFMAQKCKDEGMVVVGAGEMGVGNTTTSSAVLACLLNVDIKSITGKGAGLTDEAFEHKMGVISQAIDINSPNSFDAVDVVSKVGGFDIAAMMGFYIRSASLQMAVVIDGFISIAAALAAHRMDKNVVDYMFLSHRSAEPGYDFAAKELGILPMFDLGMRLGEGTGCPLAFNVLDASVRILRDMATFEEISIDPNQVEDNWEDSNT